MGHSPIRAILYVKKQGVEAGGELTNLQACQSFRRLVSPMTGILGRKKSGSLAYTIARIGEWPLTPGCCTFWSGSRCSLLAFIQPYLTQTVRNMWLPRNRSLRDTLLTAKGPMVGLAS